MDPWGWRMFISHSLDLGKGYEWTEIRITKLLTGLKGPKMNNARLALKRYIVLFLFNTINVCEEITTQTLTHWQTIFFKNTFGANSRAPRPEP